MVDFKELSNLPPHKYVFFALVKEFRDWEPEWQELFFKGYELEGHRGCIYEADNLRNRLFPLGVQVREIETGEVVYTAEELSFNGRVQGIRL